MLLSRTPLEDGCTSMATYQRIQGPREIVWPCLMAKKGEKEGENLEVKVIHGKWKRSRSPVVAVIYQLVGSCVVARCL